MSAVLKKSSAWHVWTEGAALAPGFWQGVPNALYHQGPGISKSGLDDINTSPLYYQTRRENPQPPTPALVIGTALHMLVLEPELFAQHYAPEPADAPRRPSSRQINTKKPSPETLYAIDWWRQFDAENAGRLLLGNSDGDTIWERDDWSTLHYMRDKIFAHPEAMIFLDPADGISELSCYWVDNTYHRLCKCRHDFLNIAHRVIVDLKSTADATLSGFQHSVHDYRYDVQAAWYQDGTRLTGELVENMVFVAAEKKPPYHVGTYEIDPGWVREGRLKYQRDLLTYHEGMKAQEWPSIPDTTRILPQPGYARFNPVS